MSVEKDKNLILPLQFLRGFAAIIVLIAHVIHGINEKITHNFQLPTPIPGAFGVYIFFVISGFVMFLISGDYFNTSGYSLKFITSRIKRIVPLYWIYTTLFIIATFIIPSEVSHNKFDFYQIISSYFFLPYQNLEGKFQPIYAIGWTLNYEMYFYAIFAIVLFFKRDLGIKIIFLYFITTVILGLFTDIAYLKHIFSPITLLFIAGIFIGISYKNNRLTYNIPNNIYYLVLIIISIIIIFINNGNEQYQSISSNIIAYITAIILVIIALLDKFNSKSIFSKLGLELGDASYSIYLSHPFSLQVFILIANKIGLINGGNAIILAIIAIIFSIICGYISYVFIEKPIINYYRKMR